MTITMNHYVPFSLFLNFQIEYAQTLSLFYQNLIISIVLLVGLEQSNIYSLQFILVRNESIHCIARQACKELGTFAFSPSCGEGPMHQCTNTQQLSLYSKIIIIVIIFYASAIYRLQFIVGLL